MSATRIRTHRCAAAFQAFGNTRSLHLTCLYRCRTDGDILGRLEDHPAALPLALYGPSCRPASSVPVASALSARRTVRAGDRVCASHEPSDQRDPEFRSVPQLEAAAHHRLPPRTHQRSRVQHGASRAILVRTGHGLLARAWLTLARAARSRSGAATAAGTATVSLGSKDWTPL